MECTECQELVNAYLDDELEEPLRANVETHLAHCTNCSLEAATLRASLRQLRETFPEQVPSPGLWEKVQAKTKTD